MKDLYKKYEKLCIEHKKSSYQVAKETGIAQSTLSDWKAGRSNPKIDKLKILADYFGVSIEYFLEDTTEEGGWEDGDKINKKSGAKAQWKNP